EQRRNDADGDHPLAEVDQEDRECERLALRSEGVGGASVPATHLADVDALEASNQLAAHEGAEQVAQQNFQQQVTHVARARTGKKTSASMQRMLPPPNRSIVGNGTDRV